jgi:FkbM family methyltransferase
LDIGANTGQFTKTILALLPNSKIYSFEPLPDCFKELQQFTDRHSNITVLNVGIGDKSGSLSFEQNAFSPSSSFLKMADAHKQAYVHTQNTKTVEVKIDRLDDITEDFNLGSSLLIKIDVQGYEDKVLQGGMKTIQQAKIVIIETSFVHLYESQPLFDNIYNSFRDWGFSYFGTIDQASDPKTGQILQGDAIFIKDNGRN